MSVIEIDATTVSKEKLIDLLKNMQTDYRPICIRRGIEKFTQEQWYNFLAVECGLEPDSRHFKGADWTMEDSYSQDLQQWWEISYQPDKAVSYAYSNTRQPLHTDNAFLQNSADLNFNLMVRQASFGGENTVYPVVKLIQDLENDDPVLLQRLFDTEVIVRKGDEGSGNKTTILRRGKHPMADWNYYRTVKDDPSVDALCQSLFDYLEQKDLAGEIEKVRLESGDCLAWNDKLILHGRTAFEAEKPFDRVFRQSMWHFV